MAGLFHHDGETANRDQGPLVSHQRINGMWNQLKDVVKATARAIRCHRMVYAGLAAAYGAGCAGMLDKAVVNQIVTGCYVALVVQRGH